MLIRIFWSVLVAIIAGIVCWLVGQLLLSIDTDITRALGGFLDRVDVIVGILAGIYYFTTGRTL